MQRKTSIRWHNVREAEGEKVLVIINPSDKEQSFPYSAELKDALYTIGGKQNPKTEPSPSRHSPQDSIISDRK